MTKKKSNHLTVVKPDEQQRRSTIIEIQESSLLTRDEIAKRVGEIRQELEAAKERYDGALFDNWTDGIPRSLDVVDVNREPVEAVYHLSPHLECMVKSLGNGIGGVDDPFELCFWSTQTAFAVGMLAGAIYADCPPATIDRFERGLVTSLHSYHWIGKGE